LTASIIPTIVRVVTFGNSFVRQFSVISRLVKKEFNPAERPTINATVPLHSEKGKNILMEMQI
jgi:hypothetical protein